VSCRACLVEPPPCPSSSSSSINWSKGTSILLLPPPHIDEDSKDGEEEEEEEDDGFPQKVITHIHIHIFNHHPNHIKKKPPRVFSMPGYTTEAVTKKK
jgi:hypothetical protein